MPWESCIVSQRTFSKDVERTRKTTTPSHRVKLLSAHNVQLKIHNKSLSRETGIRGLFKVSDICDSEPEVGMGLCRTKRRCRGGEETAPTARVSRARAWLWAERRDRETRVPVGGVGQ